LVFIPTSTKARSVTKGDARPDASLRTLSCFFVVQNDIENCPVVRGAMNALVAAGQQAQFHFWESRTW